MNQKQLPPPGTETNPVLIRNDCKKLQFSQGSIQELFGILHGIQGLHHPSGELSIVFLPAEVHTELHKQFHNNPEPTDVITFRGDPKTDFGGEICVSPDYAREYVYTNGGNFSLELTLYLVHGWLHLCGLDDLDEDDRQNMRKAEQNCIDLLENSGKIPYFKFSS